MKKIIISSLLLTIALFFIQCNENDAVAPTNTLTEAQTSASTLSASALNTNYISPYGSDTKGDGSQNNPWKTLRYAVSKVPADKGYTIHLTTGTFIEDGLIEVPPGVSIEGSGRAVTIIKAASSFYYHPATPEYGADRFLIRLSSSTPTNGNQSLRNFAVNGDSKQLHGGIYIRNRNNITIEETKVEYTNFTGIWMWDVNNSKMKNNQIFNCAWGSNSYSSGALNLGNISQLEIDNLEVNENTGYGIKAIGPDGNTIISGLKIHNSHISVIPNGLWNNGSAPNIAIELWNVNLTACEIYDSYVDNTISLVNSNSKQVSTGKQSIRVHHNTIDMDTRSHGTGYGVELTLHDVEIDHNYFLKGTQGIANWDNAKKNWDIHHNVFYAIQGAWPGEILRSQNSGLHNVKFYNNTIEFDSDKTANVIGLYGGQSENLDIRNNLFINSNKVYSFYPNSLLHLENGAQLGSLVVKNNLFDRLAIGSVPGSYATNLSLDPKIKKTGARPSDYYLPLTGSPLIGAGSIIGTAAATLTGASPNIGAY